MKQKQSNGFQTNINGNAQKSKPNNTIAKTHNSYAESNPQGIDYPQLSYEI